MDTRLIPTDAALRAMHPYMGLPRDVREAAERAILLASRVVEGMHSAECQVASLALRAYEAGYRAAKGGAR